MKQRQQGTANYPIILYMVDATDHVTPETGLVLTVTISKNGGAFAAASGAVTEIGNGIYALAGHATDRNTLGAMVVKATAAGADQFVSEYTVVPWDPFDANQGLTNLDAAVSSRLATAGYTAPTVPPTTAAIVAAMDAGSVDLDALLTAAAQIIAYVDALEARLTAPRAALLDNLVNLDVAVSSVGGGGGGGGGASAAEVWDLPAAIDGFTPRQIMRGIAAALLGDDVAASLESYEFRAVDDSKVRITGTIANRKRVETVLDLS